MKTPVYLAKTSALALLLFLESFFLTSLIHDYIKSQKYFAPPVDFMIFAIGLMFLILITNALLCGSWDKWEKYIFNPLPVALGISLVVLKANIAYAIIIFSLVYLFLSYDILIANQLKSQLLFFNPRFILKYSTKGLLFIFSLVSAALVILTAGNQIRFNVGEKVSGIVDKYLIPHVNYQINSQIEGVTEEQMKKLSAFGLDTKQISSMENGGIISSLSKSNLSVDKLIADQINAVVEPYQRFVNPVIGLIVFGLMQFLGMFAYLLYWLILDVIFWMAKKTGFIKIDLVPAEKEIAHF